MGAANSSPERTSRLRPLLRQPPRGTLPTRTQPPKRAGVQKTKMANEVGGAIVAVAADAADGEYPSPSSVKGMNPGRRPPPKQPPVSRCTSRLFCRVNQFPNTNGLGEQGRSDRR